MFGAGASEQGDSLSDGLVRFHGKTTRFGNIAAPEREHADGGGRNGTEIGPDRQRIIPVSFTPKAVPITETAFGNVLPLLIRLDAVIFTTKHLTVFRPKTFFACIT